jgi:hypothetical protein
MGVIHDGCPFPRLPGILVNRTKQISVREPLERLCPLAVAAGELVMAGVSEPHLEHERKSESSEEQMFSWGPQSRKRGWIVTVS